MPKPILDTTIPWYKKIASYIVPVKLQEFHSADHNDIHIYIHNNHLQLIFNNAIYSYGVAYMPFLHTFEHIASQVRAAKTMLVLGSGLGSIPQIVVEKYKNPNVKFTIVDIDSLILDLCNQYLRYKGIDNCKYIRQDALILLNEHPFKYDIICLDVFKDVYVPKSFTTTKFFNQINSSLNTNGLLVFNYITYHPDLEKNVMDNLAVVFTTVTVYRHNSNTVFVCTQKDH
jgi:spermidine synthase